MSSKQSTESGWGSWGLMPLDTLDRITDPAGVAGLAVLDPKKALGRLVPLLKKTDGLYRPAFPVRV